MRIAIPLLAAALLAGLLWLLADGSEPEGASAPGSTAGAGAEAAPELRAAEARVAGETPEPAAGAPPQAGNEASPAAARPHALVGHIEGLSAAQLAETWVRAIALGAHDWPRDKPLPIVGRPRADGGFSLALGDWRAEHVDLARVRLEVDHPEHVPFRLALDLAPPEDGRTEAPGPIRLEPAIRLSVRVEDAHGADIAEAPVAAYRAEGPRVALGANHEADLLAKALTNARGTAVLRLGEGGPVFVGAAGDDAHLPVLVRRAFAMGTAPEPVLLVLRDGHALGGRVLLGGRPVAGAHVGAEAVTTDPWVVLRWLRARQVGGEILPLSPSTTTDADGRFELGGLPARTHRLRVTSVSDWFMQRGLHGWEPREVVPPATGLDLDLVGATLEVRVMEGTETVEGAEVFVTRKTDTGTRTSSSAALRGRIRILLPPGVPVTIGAKHDRREPVTRELAPLAPGAHVTETLEMGPERPSASLRVRLVDAKGKPVTRAGFRLVRAADAEYGHYHGFDSGLGLKTAEDGVYRLEALEPGDAHLYVYPERDPEAHTGDWLVLDAPVTLVAEREAEVALTAKRGAAISLTVKDPQGRVLGASATLRDARGEEVPVSWFWSGDGTASVSTGGPGAANARMLPPLAPGAYDLEVGAPGHVSRTVRFEVRMGEVKSIEIVLQEE